MGYKLLRHFNKGRHFALNLNICNYIENAFGVCEWENVSPPHWQRLWLVCCLHMPINFGTNESTLLCIFFTVCVTIYVVCLPECCTVCVWVYSFCTVTSTVKYYNGEWNPVEIEQYPLAYICRGNNLRMSRRHKYYRWAWQLPTNRRRRRDDDCGKRMLKPWQWQSLMQIYLVCVCVCVDACLYANLLFCS